MAGITWKDILAEIYRNASLPQVFNEDIQSLEYPNVPRGTFAEGSFVPQPIVPLPEMGSTGGTLEMGPPKPVQGTEQSGGPLTLDDVKETLRGRAPNYPGEETSPGYYNFGDAGSIRANFRGGGKEFMANEQAAQQQWAEQSGLPLDQALKMAVYRNIPGDPAAERRVALEQRIGQLVDFINRAPAQMDVSKQLGELQGLMGVYGQSNKADADLSRYKMQGRLNDKIGTGQSLGEQDYEALGLTGNRAAERMGARSDKEGQDLYKQILGVRKQHENLQAQYVKIQQKIEDAKARNMPFLQTKDGPVEVSEAEARVDQMQDELNARKRSEQEANELLAQGDYEGARRKLVEAQVEEAREPQPTQETGGETYRGEPVHVAPDGTRYVIDPETKQRYRVPSNA